MNGEALLIISECSWLSFSASVGIIASAWIASKRAIVVVPPLIHFTTKWAFRQILKSRWLRCKGSIFAVDKSMLMHKSTIERSLRLLIEPWKTCFHVPIPAIARQRFRQAPPIGIYTLWKYNNGHFYAPFRDLNIDTGEFAHPDERRVRLFTYLPDLLLYFTWLFSIWTFVYLRTQW
jgi:hypothetical protein